MTAEDDDFIDIMPAKLAGKVMPQLVVRVMKIRSAERVQFNFDPKILDEIAGPRFDIAWSAKRRHFRISTRNLGKYEAVGSGRGNRAMLRCPIPQGFHVTDEVVDPEFFVDAEQKTITIDLEDHFKMRALPPPAPPSPATPAPSHRDIVERAKAAVPSRIDRLRDDLDDKTIRAAMGLTEARSLQLGDQRFPKAEAALVELLASRELVTKQAYMVATADPVGDDERDDKLADVIMVKVKPKLEALGITVVTRHGEGWTVIPHQRRDLKALIAQARQAEAA